MTPFLIGLGLVVAAAIAPVMLPRGEARSRAFGVLLLAGCGLTAAAGAIVLAGGGSVHQQWRSYLPGGDWVIGIDPLSAVFVIAVAVVGATNGVYGDADVRASAHPERSTEANATYAALVASLLLVVTAQSTLLFLTAWELMAISSFLLVITEHERAEVRRAGWIYVVATHAATLLLFVMFALWSSAAHDWTFASLAARWGSAPSHRGVILLLGLVAFGLKAGYVPLHFWLPPAHSASPSHVSALMSGIVIKTGVYGILRLLTLSGTPPVWFGWTVCMLGAVSALLGVLWALAQHDMKRLLAYHSVENIGIIMLGIGIGALGGAYGHPALAILGYGAAVLHTVNHALFKSLLFMAAGAVYRRTHTRNIEELGGLARRMPWTFLMFFIGAVAIIGVPPLNGFVSEWLIYVGIFETARTVGDLRLVICAAPVLALVGGLALACFAKVVGIVFLGRPRSACAAESSEVGSSYLMPQAVLAFACIAIGLLPALLATSIARVGAFVADDPAWGSVGAAATIGTLRGPMLFAIVLAAAIAVAMLARFVLGRRRPVRHAPTWGCGYPEPTARMQYTASSFASPLISMFGALSGVHEHRGATLFHSEPRDIVLDAVLARAWARVESAALRLRPIQQGRLQLYLVYLVAAVLSCLLYLIVAR